MRLLVHRGQVLLLLVVGVLAGVAVAGVCVQVDGTSMLGSLRVGQLFAAPPRSQLPSRIVIGGAAAAPRKDSAVTGSTATRATPVSAAAVQPTPTTAVVPGAVYTYPPEDRGRGGPGDGSGGGGGGHSSRGG